MQVMDLQNRDTKVSIKCSLHTPASNFTDINHMDLPFKHKERSILTTIKGIPSPSIVTKAIVIVSSTLSKVQTHVYGVA